MSIQSNEHHNKKGTQTNTALRHESKQTPHEDGKSNNVALRRWNHKKKHKIKIYSMWKPLI
jgi:hypothetical protein